MTLRPAGLPKARRQLLHRLDDPQAPIRANVGAALQPGLDLLASHLRVADMFWVSPDMAALAVSSGAQLAAARWTTADRPSPCGVLWWDGGIGTVDYQGTPIPVDGVVWGPGPGGCLIWWLIDRARVEDAVAVTGRQVVAGAVPRLVPAWGVELEVTAEPASLADLPTGAPFVPTAALAASWLLMQQPMLIDRTRQPADGPTRRQHARDGLPDPAVTVVDLRRMYVPQDQDLSSESDGRRYRHRWVVSGHWRNQAYGPDRALRRQTWVPSYVKGPEGAPLLSTEKVNVWRR